ncbi:cysteine-rich CWC family protein [Ideonella sp.]|uniref:cysteine-rich CWC family protein n=1 Tax=Ideonella sp. TaxID=1929293 RepID=UPI002B45A613|nr:cysteine-rich CWC family protein [Ideonella sp.]HJV71722.1 cysteine-rich CWC family protein [Ideonella sp.]
MNDATCPRCGKPFACGAGRPVPCACNQLQLTDALRQQLRERFTGCLCPTCLLALGAVPVTAAAAEASAASSLGATRR